MIKYIWGTHYKTNTDTTLKFCTNGFTRQREVREYEIEVYDTDGGTSVINGKSYDILKGNVLIVFPGDVRQSRPPFECYAVKFLCDDSEFISKLKEISGVNHYDTYNEIIENFKEIYSLSFEFNKEMTIDAKIRTALAMLYNGITEKKSKDNPHTPSLNMAISFINANLSQKICLKDIAEASGFSSSHFHKVFKDTYFMSPNEYLTMKRVECAKKLLMNESISIDAIAEKCGFFSRAYFDVSFKKTVGITPASFRKSLGNYDKWFLLQNPKTYDTIKTSNTDKRY